MPPLGFRGYRGRQPARRKARPRLTLVSPITRQGRRRASTRVVSRGRTYVVRRSSSPPRSPSRAVPTRQPTPVTPGQVEARQARHQRRLRQHRTRVRLKVQREAAQATRVRHSAEGPRQGRLTAGERHAFNLANAKATVRAAERATNSVNTVYAPFVAIRKLEEKLGYGEKQQERFAGKLDAGVDTGAHAVTAPAVWTLRQAGRPYHAVAGAADAAVTGKDVLKGAGRGFALKDETSFSDVLKHAGVKNKAVRGVAGFLLDLGLDPTTYVNPELGLSRSAARKAASKGVTDLETRGVRLGLRPPFGHRELRTSGATTARVARRTRRARQALREGETGVRLVRPVKTVQATRKARAVAREYGQPVPRRPVVVRSQTGSPVQGLGEGFVHDFRPSYMARGQHTKLRRAVRRYRAGRTITERQATQRAHAYEQALRGEGRNAGLDVINALERGPVDVPAHLHDLDRLYTSQSELKRAQRALPRAQRKERIALSAANKPIRTPEIREAEKAHERAVRSLGRLRGRQPTKYELRQNEQHIGSLRATVKRLKGEIRAADEQTAAGLRRQLGTTRSALTRATRARDKLRRASSTPEAVRAARQQVRDTEAQLAGVRAAAPKMTQKQADRLIFARAEAAAAQRKVDLTSQELAQVSHALATNRASVATLPPRLRQVATHVEEDSREQLQQMLQRDLGKRFQSEGPHDRQAYAVKHVSNQQLDTEAGGEVIKFGRTRGRTKAHGVQRAEVRAPLSVLDQTDRSLFSTDLPAIIATQAREVGRDAHLHDLWQEVASTGRRIQVGAENHINLPDEHVYEVTPHGLKDVTLENGKLDVATLNAIADGRRRGDFVILSPRTVQFVEQRIAPAGQADTGVERFLDRVQGGWKFLTTMPNPGFHARNLIGDSLNAWLGDARASSFVQAYRGLKAMAHRERLAGNTEAVTEHGKLYERAERALNATVKIGGRKVRIGDELEAAEREGAIHTGQVGREYQDLLHGDYAPGGRLSRAAQYREDFARFASYLSARKRGMTQAEAAEWSLKHHFDYGDLTQLERRVMRRGFPFWTFFARNSRLQAEKLLTRPGKFATIEKVLDESAKAAGFDSYDDYVSRKPDYRQRGLPIPIKVGKKTYDVYVSPPTTDLNQLTVNPTVWAQDLGNRLTFFKAIPEWLFNYSVFFEGPIQDPKAPLVPAPSFVGDLPKPLRDKLGIKKYPDKRSGKRIWGWPGKIDYVARQLPQTNLAAQLATPTAGSRGMTPLTQGIAWLTGVKTVENRPLDDAINSAYDEKTKVENRLGELRQQGFSAEKTNAEYRRLLRLDRDLQKRVYSLKRRRKDRVLPRSGGGSSSSRPSRPSPGSGGGIGGGGAGGGLGAGGS